MQESILEQRQETEMSIVVTKLCECGCGQLVTKLRNRFIHGHNLKLPNHPRNDNKGEHNSMFGKHHTEKTKNKMRKTFEERGVSKGKNNPMYGQGWKIKKAFAEGKYDNRPKAHQDYKGKTLEEIHGEEKASKIRNTMSVSAKQKKFIPGWLEHLREFGHRPWTLKEKIRASIRRKGTRMGKENPSWNGGSSKFPYPFEFTRELKQKIKERDGYICQLCDCSNPIKLGVHHIDYNKSNLSEDNLITLCRSCNIKVNRNREYWTNYFKGVCRATIENRV